MDRVVIGWVVLELTNSAWDLAVVEALRWLPLLIFGLAGGAVADRADRRLVLLCAQSLALLVCAFSAILLAAGRFNFAFAALATFLLGLQWAVDWPTRRSIVPDIVGRELTGNAMALESLSMNLTRVIGPLLAGLLIAYVSPAAAFASIAAMYVVEIAFLALMPLVERARSIGGGPMLRYLAEGFDRLRESQAIVGVLLVSVFVNILVFPYQQLLPVFARDELHVDAVGLGALNAASGFGSVVGSLALAGSAALSRSGRVFWLGSCLMSVCIVGFALASQFSIALVLLAMSGLGQAAFTSLQTAIVLRTATDQLRGRAMGALTLAIGSTPIGSLEFGVASVALGAPLAVALNASLCTVLVALVGWRLPRFRQH
jgi:MFS family permease